MKKAQVFNIAEVLLIYIFFCCLWFFISATLLPNSRSKVYLFFLNFIILLLPFRSFDYFCVWYDTKTPLILACDYLVIPTPFIKNTILSSVRLSGISVKSINELSHILWARISVSTIAPHCFDDCSSVIGFNRRKWKPPTRLVVFGGRS